MRRPTYAQHLPGGNDYGEPKGPRSAAAQIIANESWPLRDKDGGHARGIEDQPKPIDVEVRVEWASDREEWIAGTASRVMCDRVPPVDVRGLWP